jgi:5-methylcytosine-specific restriction protein A
VHRPVGALTTAERRAAYDAARVSPSRTYGRQWQRLRMLFLAAHPLCPCGNAASVVDHITSHHGNHALMYDWANLRAMCKPCHDAKTAARDGGFGNPIRPST